MEKEKLIENCETVELNNLDWYVFYVKSKHERKVELLLNRDGYITYLPIIKVVKQWTHRKKTVEEVLFKSYIFVQIERNQIFDVLQTQSVIKNIKFEGEPAILKQKHIDFIKYLIQNDRRFQLNNETIKIGEIVKLKTGSFKGQRGVIKEIRGKKRALIALESINFVIEVEI